MTHINRPSMSLSRLKFSDRKHTWREEHVGLTWMPHLCLRGHTVPYFSLEFELKPIAHVIWVTENETGKNKDKVHESSRRGCMRDVLPWWAGSPGAGRIVGTPAASSEGSRQLCLRCTLSVCLAVGSWKSLLFLSPYAFLINPFTGKFCCSAFKTKSIPRWAIVGSPRNANSKIVRHTVLSVAGSRQTVGRGSFSSVPLVFICP
ncbi:hypothetical protein HJG60_009977 [Phyllostomus discolor]|uniref:Uncharacterized protein n=1 Tax=Phyllostomus discolor TaxID=89673 RepID=A0A834BAJ1_9CHIR|nr:hypothetical protein HJG60_009977 [Phyllostomus discolor]